MTNLDSRRLARQVWAYYHPFYGTPQGPTGRWLTWNEPLWLATGYGFTPLAVPDEVRERLRHDPETFLGPQRRSNYSAFYPTLGLYDCLEPRVLEQQALWALEASLDGLLWDYMLAGEDNSDRDKPLQETIYDRSFRLMLHVLDRLNVPLQLCPFYDSFGWYQFSPDKIAEQLVYLVSTYYGHPRVLHIDQRLVVFLYATLSRHSVADWWHIRDLLAASGVGARLFLVAGEVPGGLDAPGLFDGFTQYNYDMPDWCAEGVARASSILRGLADCNGASFWTASVGPGFDGRIWHHPGRVVARGLGKRYEAMWQQAIHEQPSFVTICSFNEWGEGTQIEPCLEYEDLYLRLTAKWAAAFRSGHTSAQGA